MDANWGQAIVSYCLLCLGLGQGKESKQIKSLWAVKKDMSPCLPNEGREVLPHSTKPREPSVCKEYLFTCPQILINVRKKHFTSNIPLCFSGATEQSISQERKVWGITSSVFPGYKSQLIWLVTLEKEPAILPLSPFQTVFPYNQSSLFYL